MTDVSTTSTLGTVVAGAGKTGATGSKGKAAAAPKAAVKAKAKAQVRLPLNRLVVPRVRDDKVPLFLELLADYGYFQASRVRNGRTVQTVAAFLFQNCTQAETVYWVGVLWYKCPNSLTLAIKNKWDDYMAKTKRSTWRGVGATPDTWAVSARGAVMGDI